MEFAEAVLKSPQSLGFVNVWHFLESLSARLQMGEKKRAVPETERFPNVKNNHVEKTSHLCQFPIELIERLVLSLTNPGDLVIDPYLGVGSAACAAVMHERRAAGADLSMEYPEIARERIEQARIGDSSGPSKGEAGLYPKRARHRSSPARISAPSTAR